MADIKTYELGDRNRMGRRHVVVNGVDYMVSSNDIAAGVAVHDAGRAATRLQAALNDADADVDAEVAGYDAAVRRLACVLLGDGADAALLGDGVPSADDLATLIQIAKDARDAKRGM